MKMFKNVEEYNKFLEENYEYGLEENFEKFAKFVAGKEFGICLPYEHYDFEDAVLVLDGKTYAICENSWAIVFLEVKEDPIKPLKI